MNNTELYFQKNPYQPKQEEIITQMLEQFEPDRKLQTIEEEKEIISFILHALTTGRTALCEADKTEMRTQAYLIASVLYKLSAKDKLPIIIAAATPMQQEHIASIYLPQISRMMYQSGLIDRKLKCIIRKGKRHYLCDKRLSRYQQQTPTLPPDFSAILEKLRKVGWKEIDLDRWRLPSDMRRQICVSKCQNSCSRFSACRYQQFLQHCRNIHSYDFQITDHSYILSEREKERTGERGTLPDYNILIIDDAHMLSKPVERMFRQILPEKDLLQLYDFFPKMQDTTRKWRQLQSDFRKSVNQLFDSEDETSIKISLGLLENTLADFRSVRSRKSRETMITDISEKLLTQITGIRKNGRHFWIEGAQKGDRTVCMLPDTPDEILYQNIWNNQKKNIAVSDHKTVEDKRSDFNPLRSMQKKCPLYSSSQSQLKLPFDSRQEHTLLYIPRDFSVSETTGDKYLEYIAEITEKLAKIAGNKAIILSADKRLLADLMVKEMERCRFPIYITPFSSAKIPQEFRTAKKGLLFACNTGISMRAKPDHSLSMFIILDLSPQNQKWIEQLSNSVKTTRNSNRAFIVSILDKKILMDSYYQNHTLAPSLQIDVTHSLKQVKNFADKIKNEEISHGK